MPGLGSRLFLFNNSQIQPQMKKAILSFLCAAMIFSGCGMSNTGKGALIGTGAGAAVGAGIGAIFGHGKGAAIGAAVGTAVGASAGAIIGKKMDRRLRSLPLCRMPRSSRLKMRTVSRPSRSPSTAVSSSLPMVQAFLQTPRRSWHSSRRRCRTWLTQTSPSTATRTTPVPML